MTEKPSGNTLKGQILHKCQFSLHCAKCSEMGSNSNDSWSVLLEMYASSKIITNKLIVGHFLRNELCILCSTAKGVIHLPLAEKAIRLEWQDTQTGAKQAAQEAEPLHECRSTRRRAGGARGLVLEASGGRPGPIKASHRRWAPIAAPSPLVITARCQPIRHVWLNESRPRFCSRRAKRRLELIHFRKKVHVSNPNWF